jgi:hypothetical protein
MERYRARRTAPPTSTEGLSRNGDVLFGDDFFGRRTFATSPFDAIQKAEFAGVSQRFLP